jgi:ABC-type uncharacterized transport system substrate-binding protein
MARFSQPLDPRRAAVDADFYDDTYFTDISFPDDDPSATAMTGNPATCAWRVVRTPNRQTEAPSFQGCWTDLDRGAQLCMAGTISSAQQGL